MEKTVQMIKWGKGYYIMARMFEKPVAREWAKTKTAALALVKKYKMEGYEQI